MTDPTLEERVAALEAEVARLSQPETDADLIKRLERVFPELSRRQMKRDAANWCLRTPPRDGGPRVRPLGG